MGPVEADKCHRKSKYKGIAKSVDAYLCLPLALPQSPNEHHGTPNNQRGYDDVRFAKPKVGDEGSGHNQKAYAPAIVPHKAKPIVDKNGFLGFLKVSASP
ncbi:hypothetical protein [Sphingomonas sp. Ant H11]|uniref:hypothetical protein n=1 Tax=Sphingomonas sp. Ant H11 TaxID=1564113 RepID=UPI0012E0C353|nr:hypothetical protein [Sphingomonas sp. Ant H11]